MDNAFDVDKHIARIGARLVQEFDEARAATSPTAVGDAMESPVRKQLEHLLPRGIAVGSGFVIDSYGATSSQTDLVLYERDICPVFSINDTPGTTYYPCEGVIAVGQVKSTLTKKLLEDEFKKIASVKRLQRHPVHDFMPHPTTGGPIVLERSYGNIRNPSIIDVGVKKASSPSRQIFGFVVAGASQMSTDTLTNAFTEFTSETGEGLSPNMAVLLSGWLLTWGNVAQQKLREVKWSEGKDKAYFEMSNFDWTQHAKDCGGVRSSRNPLESVQRWQRGKRSSSLRLDPGGDTAPEGTWQGVLAFGPPPHCPA